MYETETLKKANIFLVCGYLFSDTYIRQFNFSVESEGRLGLIR